MSALRLAKKLPHPELRPDSRRKNEKKIFLCFLIFIGVFAVCLIVGIYHFPSPRSMEDFSIPRISSSCDANNNGVDDYTDILLGAKADAKKHPKYDGRYWAEGYPPDEIGVCTDVVWRAFRNAGYSLRDMVDQDIAAFPQDYPAAPVRDRNIDFRRVKNLRVFFDKYAVCLTLDIFDLSSWQPGDIVIFGDDTHIGVVSDLRDKNGVAYLLHNGGQPNREEAYLSSHRPVAHYRFDASLVPEPVLVLWNDGLSNSE